MPNMDHVVATARQHQAAGRADQARELLRRALRAEPGRHDANHLYGLLLMQSGQVEQAEYFIRRAVASRPDDCELYNSLGIVLATGGKLGPAAEAWERSIALRPAYLPALQNLVRLRLGTGDLDGAEACCKRAAAIAPHDPGVARTLAEVLTARGRTEDAAGALRAAAAQHPDNPDAQLALVRALYFVADADIHEMEACCRRAAAADPASPIASLELATLLLKTGRADEAGVLLRALARAHPGRTDVLDQLAHTLNYVDGADEREILEAHVAYGRALSAQVRPLKPPAPRGASPAAGGGPDPDRRLRVGLFSPDLRGHAVAAFLEPLVQHHDRAAFEVVCYSGTRAPDETTRRLSGYDVHWRETWAMDDRAVAELIRADGVDILIELSGHAGGSRLPVLAMKPAPVQATFIGYPNTTGVAGVDARLVDALTDPEDLGADARSVERLARIPGCFLCYRPPADADDPGVGPARGPGDPVTFGSFNNIAKVGPGLGALWARLLERVPGSRLALKSINLGPGSARRLLLERLASWGIDPARVDLSGGTSSRREHLARYAGMDVALDTFPYHGTTTTCEALWMGVPVITLAGRVHASRVGVSLLTAAGLPELIARDPEEYVRVAADLASDRGRLAGLRAGLRDRLRASTLCDAPGYARRVEGTLREIWRDAVRRGTVR